MIRHSVSQGKSENAILITSEALTAASTEWSKANRRVLSLFTATSRVKLVLKSSKSLICYQRQSEVDAMNVPSGFAHEGLHSCDAELSRTLRSCQTGA